MYTSVCVLDGSATVTIHKPNRTQWTHSYTKTHKNHLIQQKWKQDELFELAKYVQSIRTEPYSLKCNTKCTTHHRQTHTKILISKLNTKRWWFILLLLVSSWYDINFRSYFLFFVFCCLLSLVFCFNWAQLSLIPRIAGIHTRKNGRIFFSILFFNIRWENEGMRRLGCRVILIWRKAAVSSTLDTEIRMETTKELCEMHSKRVFVPFFLIFFLFFLHKTTYNTTTAPAAAENNFQRDCAILYYLLL